MKKKILSLIFSFTLILFSGVFFAGCFGFSKEDDTPHIHTYKSGYTYNETHHWIEATCECGKDKDSGRHMFSGLTCTVCGYERDAIELLKFKKIGSRSEYSLDGCTSNVMHDLVIPDEYNGWPVTYIGIGAFRDKDVRTITFGENIKGVSRFAFAQNKNLKSVTFPSNVETLDEGVFEDCTSLEEIDFGSLKSIGSRVFKGCTSLTEVTLPSTLEKTYIGMFDGCTNLKKATFTGTKQKIGGFDNCSGIEEIIIPEGCTTIAGMAFVNTPNLKNLTLPSTINTIDWSAFQNVRSDLVINFKGSLDDFARISFGDEYSSPMNCGGKLLINNEIVTTIDSSVKQINDYAFYNYNYLETVELSDGVTLIGKMAFYNCDKLRSISIPVSVATIGDKAFDNLDNLEVFEVDEDNEYFSSPDGCLLSKDGSVFYQYPLGRKILEYTVPSTVTEFKKSSFKGAKLESLTLPFVGKRADSDQYSNYIGYLFGASDYTENGDYIPSTLTTIGINGSVILQSNSLYGLTNVTNFNLTNVIGIGSDVFLGCGNAVKSLVLPSSINLSYLSGNFLNGLEGIEEVTFNEIDRGKYYFPASMKKLTILNGEEIYREPFTYGTHLESVVLPQNLKKIHYDCFLDFKNLKEITIPNSVTTIGSSAFENCESLERIVIPEGVHYIDAFTFRNCSSLLSVECLGEIYEVRARAFYGCYELANLGVSDTKDITWIGDYAFCFTDITQFDINPDIEHIGTGVFNSCFGISHLVLPFLGETLELASDRDATFDASDYIPDGIESIKIAGGGIRNNSFSRNPYSLKKLTLGKDMTFFYYECFKDFSNLEEIVLEDIGEGKKFGANAFEGCTSLNKVSVSNIEHFLKLDFDNQKSNPLYYAKNLYINGELAKNIVIPNTINSIKSYAFINGNIENVTLSTSVKSIGFEAFEGCTNLQYKNYGNLNYLSATDGENTIDYYAVMFPDVGVNHLEFNNSTGVIATNAFYYPDYNDYRYHYSYIDVGSELTWARLSFSAMGTFYSREIDNNNNPFDYGTLMYINGSKVTEFVIPENAGITSINSYLFNNISTITKVVVPEGVKTIYSKAFYNMVSLDTITLPSTLTEIYPDAFGGENELSTINISSMESWVNINMWDINSNPFTNTSATAKFYISDEVVTEFVIPNDITTIGKYQFSNVKSLSKIVIPSSVTTYEKECFINAELDVYITDINVWATSSTFNGYAANPINVSGNLYVNGEKLTDLAITDADSGKIVSYAFYNCNHLKTVVLTNLTEVGMYAFYNNIGLQSVDLGKVETVSKYSFYNCANIRGQFSLKATSVTYFGEYALYGCDGLLEEAYSLYLITSLPVPSQGRWRRYNVETREYDFYSGATDSGRNFSYYMVETYPDSHWTYEDY